jgi:hypothetical protein
MVWIALTGLALAQDPVVVPETAPEPQPLPLVFAVDHTWVEVTPALAGERSFVDLARDPFHTASLLAVDVRGGVWLSVDGGLTWSETLSPARTAGFDVNPDEEGLLLQAEANAQDLFGDEIDSDLDPDELEELEDTLAVLGDANEVDQMTDLDDDEAAENVVGLRIGGTVWYHPEESGVVLFSRADGMWRSRDGGRSFHQVGDLGTVTCFDLAPWGVVVAGTEQGIRYSPNLGRSWIRASGPLDDARVRDIAYDADSLLWYAATDSGLFVSSDGQTWTGAGDWTADLRAVVVDPNMGGGLWLATDNEVLRSDNAGATLFALARHPLPGTTNLERVDSGHLLQSGSDGVWETRDGGVAWRPVALGLPGPVVWDVVPQGDQLIAATAYGLFRLVEGTPGSSRDTVVASNEVVPALDTVLEMALERTGMDPVNDGRFNSSRVLKRRGIPELSFKGQATDDTRLGADYSALSNDGDDGLTWKVSAELRWGRGDAVDNTYADVQDSYFVLGDQVYSANDQAALPAAAANVTSRSVQYRQVIAGTLMELYFTRNELVRQRDSLPPDDLRGRAHHELKIQEVTAMMDVYTEGGFSTALNGGT